jgi:hypothetical protein
MPSHTIHLPFGKTILVIALQWLLDACRVTPVFAQINEWTGLGTQWDQSTSWTLGNPQQNQAIKGVTTD